MARQRRHVEPRQKRVDKADRRTSLTSMETAWATYSTLRNTKTSDFSYQGVLKMSFSFGVHSFLFVNAALVAHHARLTSLLQCNYCRLKRTSSHGPTETSCRTLATAR